jgi:hypothetical protein
MLGGYWRFGDETLREKQSSFGHIRQGFERTRDAGPSRESPKTPEIDFLGFIKAEGESETPMDLVFTILKRVICSRSDQSQ